MTWQIVTGAISLPCDSQWRSHGSSPTLSALPPSMNGPSSRPGMSTGQNSTGIAALAATACGRSRSDVRWDQTRRGGLASTEGREAPPR